jgi:hypothetical protein
VFLASAVFHATVVEYSIDWVRLLIFQGLSPLC